MDQIYRIINQIEGLDKLDQLTAKLSQARQNLQALYEAEKAAHAAGAAWSSQMQDAAAKVAALDSQVQKAERSMKNYTHTINQIGYAVDDLQYGWKGIANNIQPILSSIPGIGAWAAGIASAATAAYQLITHWEFFAKLVGGGHVKTQAEELDELAKKTKLAADEAERLNRAQGIDNKVKELQTSKPKAVKAVESAVTDALVEADPQTVARAMLKNAPDMIDSQGEAAQVQQKIADLRREQDTVRKAGAAGAIDDAAAQIDEIEQKIKEMTTGAQSELEVARRNTAQGKTAQSALEDWGTKPLQDLINLVKKDLAGFGGGDVKKGEKLLKSLEDAQLAGTKDEGKKAAANLQERYNVDRARGGPDKTQADIEADLMRGGATKEEAAKVAASTLKALQEGFTEEIKKRAGQKGLDTAGAAKSILDDDAEKAKHTPEAKEEMARAKAFEDAFKKNVAEDRKSKSYLDDQGKVKVNLTKSQEVAKEQDDQEKADKAHKKEIFNNRVAEARRTRSFMGKDEDDLNEWEKEAKKEEDKDQKKLVHKAKDQLDSIPKLGDQIQGELLKRGMKGMDPKKAAEQVEGKLAAQLQMQHGIGAQEAFDMAHEKVSDAQKKLTEDLLSGGEQQQQRHSETVDAGASFAAKIQAGVSNDNILKDQRDLLKLILDEIKKNPAAAAAFIPRFQGGN